METVIDYPRDLTFEKVWAMFQETDKKFQETDKKFQETDRLYKELAEERKETARLFKELAEERKETERQIKELNVQMGGLNNSFGEMAEHLVAPGIAKRFNELGFHFDEVAKRGIEIKDKSGNIIAEADLVLENGDYIIIVEVKSKPKLNDKDEKKDDIKKHIKRMEKFRLYYKKAGDRKLRGAIAGAIFGKKEKEAAIDAGFYVLEQSGDTMKLEIPEGFVPQEW